MTNKIHDFTYLTLFIAIEIVISVVPFLGFIPLGFINATTLHIPVILAGILLSKKDGAIVGFVFGMASFLKSTFEPNLTSFLFSPFYSLGGISGNLASLLIAFVPRILVGYMSGLIFEKLKKRRENTKVLVTSFIASFVFNTSMVMGMAFIFFKESYAMAMGISGDLVFKAIMTVIFTNGIVEAVISMIIVLAVYKAAKKIMKGV